MWKIILCIFRTYAISVLYFLSQTGQLAKGGDNFVDGAVIAAARTLPTWSDGDVPIIPSIERKAAKELQEQCQECLAKYPTTSKQDQRILGNFLLKLFPNPSVFIEIDFLPFECRKRQ